MERRTKNWDGFAWLSLAVLLWMAWDALQAIIGSWDWRLVHDAPIMHYVASMITKGYMPYRDIMEINLPFTYWLHILALGIFGDGDFAFRLFDLSWTLLCAALIAALCWRKASMLGVGAGFAFLVIHVANSAASMAQRDLLMVPFLLGAALGVLKAPGGSAKRQVRMWAVAGMCAGCAAAIKPIAILLPVLLFAAVLYSENWNARAQLRPWLVFAAGFALPLLASVFWLLQQGIMGDFIDVMTHLVAAIYAEVQSPDWIEKAGLLTTATLVVSLITYSGHLGEEKSRRHLIIQAGLWYGLLHYCMQRKGFWYNLYPFYAFAGVGLACACEAFIRRLRLEGRLVAVLLLFGGCAYASPIGLLAPDNMYGADWLQPYFKQLDDNMKTARGKVLDEFPQMQREGSIKWRVHFFDFSTGALWAYAYREGWEPVSRFQHPYPFYMNDHSEAMQRYRIEMLQGLAANPPHIIIVSKQSWPRNDGLVYDIIDGKDGNKDISAFFKTNYQLAYANGMYRIYSRINPEKHAAPAKPARKRAKVQAVP